jgi:hypothetical protein
VHYLGKNYRGENVNVLMQMARACHGMTVVMPDEDEAVWTEEKKKPFEDPKPKNLQVDYLSLSVLS